VGEPPAKPPRRSGRRPGPAVAAVVAVLACTWSGCASPGSGIEAGEHVTVYVSSPLRGPEASQGRDVADGARLALANARGRVGGLAVRARYLDDTGPGADVGWSPAAAAANARRAAEDSTAIAYLGDFDSGATRSSLPITNQARLLQVSPASAAVDLVQPYLGAGDRLPRPCPTGRGSGTCSWSPSGPRLPASHTPRHPPSSSTTEALRTMSRPRSGDSSQPIVRSRA
jgi:hypothetical protein